jgi:hypothetical protein
LRQVYSKLKVVLQPLGKERQNDVLDKLKECKLINQLWSYIINYYYNYFSKLWCEGDLWGPLLVCLILSTLLSLSAPSDSSSLVFASVFVVVWAGSAIVTLNAQLLGGSISFFQSVCILGYCIFPLTISSLVCFILSFIIKQVMLSLYNLFWILCILIAYLSWNIISHIFSLSYRLLLDGG